MKINRFASTFNYKLIYIFRINDKLHKGKLKIGEATVYTDKKSTELLPNCNELKKAAIKRINSYTSTAGIVYELLYTELALTKAGDAFRDTMVHNVLLRSGIKRHYFDTTNRQNEWFETDLETVKAAIKAVKEGKMSLTPSQISYNKSPIIFRPEQEKAIKQTIENFKNNDIMLWNAKMRFGKTLATLEIIKRKKYKKTIIMTHRPVVNDSWFEDFQKIFIEKDNKYQFGSKSKGETIEKLINSDEPFVYFASIQDLRGSSEVGGNFEKNEIIFDTEWDLVVIDEAHEGTKTELGERTIERVVKTAKVLMLSGTPFNLLSDFKENQIYTWDYINEQSAKLEWEQEHYGDHNPYEDLPQMNIYTYYLDKLLPAYVDVSDNAFNFREFFRTWTGNIELDKKPMPKGSKVGEFINEKDVKAFLDLLCKKDEKSNYPYSTDEYRNYFRHSLWMVPGVKEAQALSKLLKEHRVFGSGMFKIVNVAGDGDEEEKYEDALKKVKEAITNKPENTYTITISCGRLTTGVNVKEWTAVFMLSGSYFTSAASYLQTIFRVQTPGEIGGKVKEKCYVFDFAPDRTLKMVAQAGQLSLKPGSIESKVIMGDFLNFCPVIGIDGSQMISYDVTQMLRQLKKAVAQRVVINGFDDKNIYNDNLLKLDDIDLKEFDDLKKIIGISKQTKKIEEIDINSQGFTNEEYEEIEKIKRKPRRELTDEEKARLEELKEKKKQASTAISILRGISIRIPLLIYGADIKKDIDIENFVKIIDDKSWKEFMPQGVTKEIFKKFSKYYDNEIFIEAGRQIRNTTLNADSLPIKERIQRLSEIFSMFRNPDKETVLTPWRTVNMHLSDCIGGYNFNYPDNEPRFVNQGNVTRDLFNNNKAKILEINSKTGLYALYCAYSIYMNRLLNYHKNDYTEEKYEKFWKETLENNIYIICKTKMAIQIAKRTLCGFKNYKINYLLKDIYKDYNENPNKCVEDILKYGRNGDKMNFDAIVGNPPYQETISKNESNDSLGKQIFPNFIKASIEIKPKYISLITPSRWFTGQGQDRSFPALREFIKENNHFLKIVNYPNNKELFNNVNIPGGVNYYLFDSNYSGNVEFVEKGAANDEDTIINRPLFEKDMDIVIAEYKYFSIISKVVLKNKNFESLTNITKGRNAFGITGKEVNNKKVFKDEKFKDSLKVLCAYEQVKYVSKKHIIKNVELMERYKVFISKANGGAGLLSDERQVQIIGKAFIGGPGTVCSDSLIPIGMFEKKEEATNLKKYMETKFLRFMVGVLKTSQNLYQNVYEYVPMQDFSNNSDITWNESVQNIDRELYAKYHLTKEEIKYIENKIEYIS